MSASSKYEILDKIGQGGMGVVYRVRHRELGTILALKMLPPDLAGEPELVARFRREARVMARLSHPHIVRVFDLVQEGDAFYLVMEYLRGRNLREHLQVHMASQHQPMALPDVLRIGVEVADALAYAHEQTPAVIHRDIKPPNIIIEEGTGRAVVTDFGIAMLAGESQTKLTRTGGFVGTLKYSSPEQMRHDADVDGRADVYSLGMVLYELYTGRQYFAGLTDEEVIGRVLYNPQEDSGAIPESEPQFAEIIRLAIARERHERYGSARALLVDLQECLRAHQVDAPPAPAAPDWTSAAPAPASAPPETSAPAPPASWTSLASSPTSASDATLVDWAAEAAEVRHPRALRRRLTANLRYLAARWWILVAVVPALIVAVLCTTDGLPWVGRPFPGFFIMENAVVPTAAAYHWSGRRAGLPNHGVIEEVSGDPLAAANDVYDYAEALPVGTAIEYRVRKGPDDRVFTIPTMLFTMLDYGLTFGLLGLNGIVIIFTGFVVAMLSPKNDAARVFFVMSLMMGLYPVTGADLWRSHDYTALQLLLQCLAPATFIHLAAVFPVERAIGGRWRGVLLALPYVVGLALATWLLRGFWANPVDLRPLYAGYAYSALGLIVLVAGTLQAYVQYRRQVVRGRVQVVMLGVVLAFLLPIAGFVDNMLAGGEFPLNLIAFTPIFFFVAVAYAIVKHKLFDTQLFIRRSVTLACLLAGFTTLYVAAITLLNTVLANSGLEPSSPTFMGGFMAVSLASALPLRDQVNAAIERRLFPHKVRSHQTIDLLCRSIARTDDLAQVLDEATRGLASAMQLTAGGVLLREVDGRTFRMAATFGAAPSTYVLPADSSLAHVLATTRRELFADDLREDADLSAIRDACLPHFDALQAELILPLLAGEVMVGMLAIGRHPGSDLLTSEDLQMLRSLAAGLALAAGRSADVFQAQRMALQRRILEHYLPPPAMRGLLGREPARPTLERGRVTSLCIRLQALDERALAAEPEAVSEMVRELYALCRAAVEDHGGVIERLEAERVRAIFRTVPGGEGADLRAARAAVAIRKALDLHRERPGAGTSLGHVGMGLASGVGQVARVEHGSRPVEHLLGGVGTIAERLSAHAGDGRILADGASARAVAPALIGTPYERAAIAGLPSDVDVFDLGEAAA